MKVSAHWHSLLRGSVEKMAKEGCNFSAASARFSHGGEEAHIRIQRLAGILTWQKKCFILSAKVSMSSAPRETARNSVRAHTFLEDALIRVWKKDQKLGESKHNELFRSGF